MVSDFCFCLFERMPFYKSQNITKPSDSKLKFLLLGNPVRCHNDKIHLVRTGRFFLGFFDFGRTVHPPFNPNQTGLFGLSIDRGGVECARRTFRAISASFFIRNQPNMVSNESWHLYLPLEPLNTILSCIVVS